MLRPRTKRLNMTPQPPPPNFFCPLELVCLILQNTLNLEKWKYFKIKNKLFSLKFHDFPKINTLMTKRHVVTKLAKCFFKLGEVYGFSFKTINLIPDKKSLCKKVMLGPAKRVNRNM